MLTKTAIIILSVPALAFVFCCSVRAATYYVDQSHPPASDNNPGTEALPWKTINHAATVLRAGDTVLVKEGTYNVGASPNWAVPAVNPSHSGTADNPITFRVCSGHKVTITTSGGQAAIGSGNQNYIVWDGFIVDMANRLKGIIIYGGKGCIIKYCEVIGNYMPTGDNHDGIRIERAEGCWIHHNIIHGVKGNSLNSAGIKVYSKGVKNVIVEDNYIYDNTAGVFDKDFGVQDTYRRNYFTRNKTQFYGNNQGGPALYYIYDNVFDGKIELHAGNTGTEVHDNLVHSDQLTGAWAGGVVNTKIWNNIVISKGPSIMACQIKKQQLSSALAYMDYNVYDADPTYDFGEYTPNHQRFSLGQMQSTGFEKNSHVVSSVKDVFEDEKSYKLLPRWKTAGRYGDAVGPENIAVVLDTARYGPLCNVHVAGNEMIGIEKEQGGGANFKRGGPNSDSSYTWSFEKDELGAVPMGWKAQTPTAIWQVIEDKTALSGKKVLGITGHKRKSNSVRDACWTDAVLFLNGEIEVRFKAVGGRMEKGGGLAWRLQDEKTYYSARTNYGPRGNNVGLYCMVNWDRVWKTYAENVFLSVGKWYTMRIIHRGANIRVYLDGKKLLDVMHKNSPLSKPGGVGVCTKGDAITCFDDLIIRSSKSKPEAPK